MVLVLHWWQHNDFVTRFFTLFNQKPCLLSQFSNVPSSDGWELDDEGEYAETSCGQQQAKDKTKITHKLVTEIEPE